MAGMSTVLTEFSNMGNSRTYTVTGHTAVKPRLVIQKRKIPSSPAGSAEVSFSVVYATVDSEGSILSSKVAMEAVVRYPVLGDNADITTVLAVFRDLISSDEFTTTVQTTGWLK